MPIYQVAGMTCDHCKASIIEEVETVAGVRHIDIDVRSGRLTVDGDVNDGEIKAAVEEAGYRVVP